MRRILVVLSFIFGVTVSTLLLQYDVQYETCSRETPYPLFNIGHLATSFIVSVPRVPTLCNLNSVENIVKFNCRTTYSDEYFTVDFSDMRTYYDRFDANATFSFIVHGWFGDCYNDWPLEMMNVLSAFEPMNVCCVDWSQWAQCNYIANAQIYVHEVGEYLANTVKFIHNEFGIDLNRFVLIGHSFGGQIIGIAGKSFPFPNQLPLGLALDPAGYLFTKPIELPPNRRLSATDFKITKAIYTDTKGLGSPKPMAAINIYANGGHDQPNCNFDLLPIGGVDTFPCSHFDANAFFIESMRENQANIYPIISTEGIRDYFRLYAKDIPGDYFLTTTECYPYTSPPQDYLSFFTV